eukprot:4440887-Amphidinium_carterae.2
MAAEWEEAVAVCEARAGAISLGLRTAGHLTHFVSAHAPHPGYGEEHQKMYLDTLGVLLQDKHFIMGIDANSSIFHFRDSDVAGPCVLHNSDQDHL